MKSRTPRPQSATSIGAAPIDDQTLRMRNYVITMGIRLGCFVCMFVFQPVGWHTAVLAIGAIFLPYVAVIIVNQAQSGDVAEAERPEIAIDAAAPVTRDDAEQSRVIRISESDDRGAAA